MSGLVKPRSKSKQRRNDQKCSQGIETVVVSTLTFDVFYYQKFIFLKIFLNYYGYNDKFSLVINGRETLIQENSIEVFLWKYTLGFLSHVF